VVEYLTEQLVTTYGTDDTTKTILDTYDFHIFPVVNPDGFVYTQTTNRMWRKNRQPPPSGRCIGRDINRNWPYVNINLSDSLGMQIEAVDCAETRSDLFSQSWQNLLAYYGTRPL
jgi:murein tripeptide amidase MpaA